MKAVTLCGHSPANHYADWEGNGVERRWSGKIGEWYSNRSPHPIVLCMSYRAWWGWTDDVICPPNYRIRLKSSSEDESVFELKPL